MIIRSGAFKCSSEKVGQCPQDKLEFAFIGRSNVGKSSLINMLAGAGKIAKVSSTPGKTRLINHFEINNEWYLVDLPGYGYAKVSKDKREGFSKLITDYLTKHENLYYLFVLIDSRIEPQKIDLEFIRFVASHRIPFGLVFTKTDKLTGNQVESNVARYKRTLRLEWSELPMMFITSAEKKTGRDNVLDFIDCCMDEYKKNNA